MRIEDLDCDRVCAEHSAGASGDWYDTGDQTHVLIVDDIPVRAERLEQQLLECRPAWRIGLAFGPREAREVLRARKWSAVVAADSRGARGVIDVLCATRDQCPGAMRVAIVDGELATRGVVAASVAHRVKTGRPQAGSLASAIASAQLLESLLSDRSLRDRIARIERLPSNPGIALTLMRENVEGTAYIPAIAQRLLGDAPLSARLLQLSNTAYYARGTPILQIERALTRLGLNTVISLIFALEAFPSARDAKLQSRAMLSAQIATRVLRDMGQVQLAPVAATAATLANIGKLLPLVGMNAGCASPFDTRNDALRALRLHSLAGAYLLCLWGLPWPIVGAVAFKDQPALAAEDGFGITAAVHVACALADGESVDEEFLESVDAARHAPSWMREAERLSGSRS